MPLRTGRVNYDRSSNVSTSKLPPAFAVGSQFDAFLKRALSRFFDRATLETEVWADQMADGPLAIEATGDPAALIIQWFGNRHVLRVPPQRPFTENEVQFAQAIGAVLESRLRAILNPELLVERPGLFRGAIEDRYVGAFFDGTPYSPPGGWRALGTSRRGPRNAARGGALDL